jgi:hypothetical protein
MAKVIKDNIIVDLSTEKEGIKLAINTISNNHIFIAKDRIVSHNYLNTRYREDERMLWTERISEYLENNVKNPDEILSNDIVGIFGVLSYRLQNGLNVPNNIKIEDISIYYPRERWTSDNSSIIVDEDMVCDKDYIFIIENYLFELI